MLEEEKYTYPFHICGNLLRYSVPHDNGECIAARKLDSRECKGEGSVVGFICPRSNFSTTGACYEMRLLRGPIQMENYTASTAKSCLTS